MMEDRVENKKGKRVTEGTIYMAQPLKRRWQISACQNQLVKGLGFKVSRGIRV